MSSTDLELFKQNGFLLLGKALTDEEVNRFRGLYDRDRSERGYFWRLIGRSRLCCPLPFDRRCRLQAYPEACICPDEVAVGSVRPGVAEALSPKR